MRKDRKKNLPKPKVDSPFKVTTRDLIVINNITVGVIASLITYWVTKPDDTNLFHTSVLKCYPAILDSLSGANSLGSFQSEFEVQVFLKDDFSSQSRILLNTDSPIADITTIGAEGIESYPIIKDQISAGGVGEKGIEIDLGPMQKMTTRRLIIRFKNPDPQIIDLRIWNDKYQSEPFKNSFSLREKLLTNILPENLTWHVYESNKGESLTCLGKRTMLKVGE